MVAIYQDRTFQQLETERLILRPLTFEDTDAVYYHFSNSDVTEYLLDEDRLSHIAQAKEMVQLYMDPILKPNNRWGIIYKPNLELIGTCGFYRWEKEHFRAEIRYDLGRDYWGLGLMSEALNEVLNFGFIHLNLNRINAFTSVENTRNIYLLKKFGFKEEGKLKEYFYFGGKFCDHILFSFLKKYWDK